MKSRRTLRAPLPARPRPQHDELLSSWLVRLARANALKVQELLTLVTGTRSSYMGRDLDARIDPAFADALGHLSGMLPSALIDLTFEATGAELTCVEQPKKGGRRWILPMVSKQRRPTAPWLQLCIACLRDDPVPYIRRRWRYAFATTCHKHRTLLIAACPFCEAPFDFTAHDIGEQRADCVVPVSECSTCRGDVRSALATPIVVGREIVRYEHALCSAAARGWTRVRGTGWIYSHQMFDVLHRLLRLLNASPGLQLLLNETVGVRGLFDERPALIEGRFENWPLSARHIAMCWLSEMFRGWPNVFVERCLRLRVLSYAILGQRGPVPYWFSRVVHDQLYRPWYAPNAEEIDSIRRAIARAGQPDIHYNRRRWLGLYHENKPYMRQIIEGPSPRQLELFEGAAIEGKARLLSEMRLHVGDMLKCIARSILDHLLASMRARG